MYATPPDDVLWTNGGPRMWFHIWPDTMAKQKNCEHEMLAHVQSQRCMQDVEVCLYALSDLSAAY